MYGINYIPQSVPPRILAAPGLENHNKETVLGAAPPRTAHVQLCQRAVVVVGAPPS